MSESKLYLISRSYTFVSHLAGALFYSVYRDVEYHNLNKIPKDGAIIYAPNHTSAFMDALTVFNLDKKPKVFLARADMFKIKPLAKILTFGKVLPVMRMRDGYSELKKNDKSISDAIDVLENGVALNVFPEGTHEGKHSLIPLLKGIFRIAIRTQLELEDKMPVYIVPVSIVYGNFLRYRSTVRAEVLDPINVSEFLKSYEDPLSPKTINAFKELLFNRMKDGIVYIKNDEYYNAKYDLCAIAVEGEKANYTVQFDKNRATLAKIEEMQKQGSASELLEMANEFSELRRKRGISLKSVISKGGKALLIPKILLLLLTMPFAIVGNVLGLPISILVPILSKLMDDPIMNNTDRYVLTLIFWPIMVLVGTLVLFAHLPWVVALVLALFVVLPSNRYALIYNKLLRLTISDIRYLNNKKLRKLIPILKSNLI